MSYEKRVVGIDHGFTRAYLEKRAKECAEEEKKKLLDEEKEKLRLYLEILEL